MLLECIRTLLVIFGSKINSAVLESEFIISLSKYHLIYDAIVFSFSSLEENLQNSLCSSWWLKKEVQWEWLIFFI